MGFWHLIFGYYGGVEPITPEFGRLMSGQIYQDGMRSGQTYHDGMRAAQTYQDGIRAGQVR